MQTQPFSYEMLTGFHFRRERWLGGVHGNSLLVQKPEKIVELRDLYVTGFSIRMACAETGIGFEAIRKYYNMFKKMGIQRELCKCGKPPDHWGTCLARRGYNALKWKNGHSRYTD